MKYYYKEAISRFMHMLFKEPQVILMSSLIYTLLALPVLTVGLAAVVSIHYCAQHENGYKCGFRQAMLQTAQIRKDALLMGLIDISILLISLGSVIAMLSNIPVMMKAIYAVLLQFDLLFLFTGIFRYAALDQQRMGVKKAISTGITLAIGNLGWLLLYGCLLLMLFMICFITGIGVVLIFPGATAMLSYLAWHETIKCYQSFIASDKEERKIA